MKSEATYTELHCHSYFSLLDGASSPEDLVRRAAELGMESLALTDHDAVYGAVRFSQACQRYDVRPVSGAELTLTGGHHLTLLVGDASGWANLCRLISAARHNAPKGEAALPPHLLADHAAGLIALSGCRHGEIAAALLGGGVDAALTAARRYADWFGRDRFFVELQHHLLPHDEALNTDLVALAERVGVGIVATNNVHYASRDSHRLQDVLVCIRHNTSLDDAHSLLRPNSEYHLKSAAEMQTLFAAYPRALENTSHIAARCDFDLHFGLQALPVFPAPDGLSAHDYLAALCQEGLQRRGIQPAEAVLCQLEHELAVIERSGLSNYLLIVWDIVRFANDSGILCQGRGSAANSLAAYLLGISPVNPLEHDLVFERFLSDERQVVPDLDIDFDAARREEVIQYVYRRYGLEHAAMACTFITFRARSALRDVGKALGLPPELLDRASRQIDTYKSGRIAENGRLREQVDSSRTWSLLAELTRQIDGLPRHLGIHNGGMVVMGAALAERLPTEPATMPERFVVQWDKESLEDAGLVKIDLLGLRMLSLIADASALAGVSPEMDGFDDPAVYEMVSAADTVGVFQVESRAQQNVLPRLKPDRFNDLVVSISLIRPGPIQGDMVHPYLRRRSGEEVVTYAHERLRPALAETLGVVLFQEQVLKVARDLAGFTPGQGELLRRALGRKNAEDAIRSFHDDFTIGAARLGVAGDVAGAVFETLRAFGGYSFPKSHAAAFAVLVYRSAWLKCYHAPAFYCALLNHQPMGFWSPAVIVNDARRHGVPVLPVDIHHSQTRCTVEGDGIRLGFEQVKGLSAGHGEAIMTARGRREFRDLGDFCQRTQLPRRLVEHLILAGAMDGWGHTRRWLVWELGRLEYRAGTLDLDLPPDEVSFPAVSPLAALGVEYELLGLSTGRHVMALYRPQLDERGIFSSDDLADCADGRRVRVAGLVVVHQAPPTAKGTHFVTLEDEYGFINIVLRPEVYTKYRAVVRECPLLVVEGVVQQRDSVVNVVASRVMGM